jgi:hypothetical protein
VERKRQREIALVVVAVALVATVMWRLQSAYSPGVTLQTSATEPLRQNGRPSAKSPATEVDLAALEAARPEPGESTRNPFRFTPKPVPPPPPAPTKPPTGPVDAGPVEPPPPRIPLKFIGIMSSNDERKLGRVAILSDARGGVFYGREGEIVEGRYRILKIGVESIDIAYLDGRGRQTIRHTGQ